MRALRLALLSMLAALTLAPATGAIVDGELDTTHDYVVFVSQRLLYETPEGAILNVGGTACTGTLVAPTVVVTAAHCSFVPPNPPRSVPPGSTFLGVAGYEVRRGPSVPPDSPALYDSALGQIHVQPFFGFGGAGLPHFSNNDLAVIELATPLPGPYAQLPELGQAAAVRPTDDLLVVGYGVSALHGNTPLAASFDYRRRSAAARLLGSAAVSDDLVHFNGPTCRGDSGGPLLDGDAILAVISFAPSACRSTNYATRLDTADSLAFVRSFLD